MKTILLCAAACLLFFCRCTKQPLSENSISSSPSFKKFIIPEGQHYATENAFKTIETSEMKFVVRFDSSAIYLTSDPENQYDINKLWGFSDNGDQHQMFSARLGWRWSEGALRIFAYTYNNGVRDSKEICTVNIGDEIVCSIKITGNAYVFSVNGKVETMARASTTASAKGYQLYPYFGGDETAPHEVRIWIKEN